jgi:hypothetical protein
MKKYILILGIIFLSCCTKQYNSDVQVTQLDNADIDEHDKTKPLIIGGKQYNRRYKIEPPDSKALALGDIDDIEILVLDIDPLNSSGMKNLAGIEQLFNAQNIKWIRINGKNLDNIDLSPLIQFNNITNFSISVNGSSHVLPNLTAFKLLRVLNIWEATFEQPYTLYAPPSLTNLVLGGANLYNVDLSVVETLHDLHGLSITGNITRLPNLTNLQDLRSISITGSQLESLKGIGAPNARKIVIGNEKEIDSLAPLNNLAFLEDLRIDIPRVKEYKIADMANLPSLKILSISGIKIDLQGIENLTMVEDLWLEYCEPFNIEGIGKLTNLTRLSINLISPEPSLDFFLDMPNISSLTLYADSGRDFFSEETEAYQVLDLSPLATLKNLNSLKCENFIIKNISALDNLALSSKIEDNFSHYIFLNRSRLFDETEESKHRLMFEYPHE